MIVVSGKLKIAEGKRDEFLDRSKSSILAARNADGCVDFAVSPDVIEPDRVNVFEEWNSQAELDSFRGSGPSDDLFDLVESFDVSERPID